MKLPFLKAKTRELWNYSHKTHSAIVIDAHFKPEMRHYGDLRRKVTWEQAYCHFYARYIYDCCLDAYTVVFGLSISEEDWRYPYRELIFAEYLKLPESLELLRLGLEQIFIDPDDYTPQEREEAYGVLGLVQKQPRGDGWLPDEFVQRLRLQGTTAQA